MHIGSRLFQDWVQRELSSPLPPVDSLPAVQRHRRMSAPGRRSTAHDSEFNRRAKEGFKYWYREKTKPPTLGKFLESLDRRHGASAHCTCVSVTYRITIHVRACVRVCNIPHHVIRVLCQCTVSVYCISVLYQCSVSVCCISVLYQCTVSVYCISVLYQCSVSVYCISVLCQCAVSVYCVSVLQQCTVSVFCISVLCTVVTVYCAKCTAESCVRNEDLNPKCHSSQCTLSYYYCHFDNMHCVVMLSAVCVCASLL